VARFRFRTKPEPSFDTDVPASSEAGSAEVLARRFGVRRKSHPSESVADRLSDPDEGRFQSRRAAGKTPPIFPLAVAGVILALAGLLTWLALMAEDTAERLKRRTPHVTVPVLLPDGTPRFPGIAAEEATVDPMDVPVALAASRNDALLEKTSAGLLPRPGEDGMAPWQYFARPFPQDDPRPRIAIVLTDMGVSRRATDTAVARLPGAVTLAFQAELDGLQAMIDQARADGHEVLLSVPMEPMGYPLNDPGPGTLLTSLSDERNVERLEKAMGSAMGYVGLTSTTGTLFTTRAENLRPILQQVQRRGLLFVDSWLVTASQATRLATELSLPRALADVQIDRVASPIGIDAQLAELERLAKINGVAVGFAQPLPVTIERLAEWAATLRDRGVVLAPVSAVVNRQADR